MIPKIDYHIHTHYLKCANETMVVADIVRKCEELGVESLAITDHLNALDRLPGHVSIREDLGKVKSKLDIHFGVELNFGNYRSH